jgi:hypothetical protein
MESGLMNDLEILRYTADNMELPEEAICPVCGRAMVSDPFILYSMSYCLFGNDTEKMIEQCYRYFGGTLEELLEEAKNRLVRGHYYSTFEDNHKDLLDKISNKLKILFSEEELE